jgi:hypothetical protein
MQMHACRERTEDLRETSEIEPGTRFRLDGTLYTTNGTYQAKNQEFAPEVEAFALDGSTPMRRRFLASRVKRAIKAYRANQQSIAAMRRAAR